MVLTRILLIAALLVALYPQLPPPRSQAQYSPPANPLRSWSVIIGDPDVSSSALADGNDSPVAIANDFRQDIRIISVACWANAGTPIVTPILTAGTSTSILTGPLTCGAASWVAGTVQGTQPVLHSFSADGATCSSTPCTIDANITTAGGVAKYLIIKVVATL